MASDNFKDILNELKEPIPNFKNLFQLAYGAMRWRVLETALELRVFDYLDKPVSAADVARLIDSHVENCRLFLDGLAALGLLTKQVGNYRNTPLASAFLVNNRSTYLGYLLRDQGNMNQLSVENMITLVKNGPDTDKIQDSDSGYWKDMVYHYANYLRAGITQLYLKIIADQPELNSPKKMLDLGGGPGITAIALAANYPGLSAVIFEQPEVADVANELSTLYGLDSRVSVLAGDYKVDEIGEDYDFVFAGFTLNYARAELGKLFSKIRDAMVPGGIFVSVGDGLTDERTQPADYIVGMLPVSLSGQDMGFDKGEVAACMQETGFEVLRSYVLDSPTGPMDIDIAKK